MRGEGAKQLSVGKTTITQRPDFELINFHLHNRLCVAALSWLTKVHSTVVTALLENFGLMCSVALCICTLTCSI